MRRSSPFAYLALAAAMLLLLSLPKPFADSVRGFATACCKPLWSSTLSFWIDEEGLSTAPSAIDVNGELYSLQLENMRLRELFQQELHLIAQLSHHHGDDSDLLAVRRHRQERTDSVVTQLDALPAAIIYRGNATWNSSLWVNVGESDNTRLGRRAIEKNSPVVIGANLVGLVDYVGSRQSRIRLITDVGLTPAVRAVRGGEQEQRISETITFLQGLLSTRKELFDSVEGKKKAMSLLENIKQKLNVDAPTLYLAKGELQGCCKPFWRVGKVTLKGVGFNYEFADDEGPARDLRSGKPYGEMTKGAVTLPLVKSGDILVTTGMDGVFPPGLRVAQVVRIMPLKEGDYYYELEAEPCVTNFDDLSVVYIMPPYGYDPLDQP